MNKFKKFCEAAYELSPQQVTPEVQEGPQWDVLLFCGDYNPITICEYNRIRSFINGYVKENRNLFANKVEVGLVVDYDETLEEDITNKRNFSLTLEERRFLTTSLFGLKMFPVNMKEIAHLTLFANEESEVQELNEETAEVVDTFKQNFFGSNVLVVLRSTDHMSENLVEGIQTLVKGENQIGAIVFEDSAHQKTIASNIPIDGNIVKALVLMDHDKPDPADIRTFAHNYKLGPYTEFMKRIHFRTDNENYFDLFRTVFPKVSTNGEDDKSAEWNQRIVMEMLKKMYLRNSAE